MEKVIGGERGRGREGKQILSKGINGRESGG